jgi:hypothetical protein
MVGCRTSAAISRSRHFWIGLHAAFSPRSPGPLPFARAEPIGAVSASSAAVGREPDRRSAWPSNSSSRSRPRACSGSTASSAASADAASSTGGRLRRATVTPARGRTCNPAAAATRRGLTRAAPLPCEGQRFQARSARHVTASDKRGHEAGLHSRVCASTNAGLDPCAQSTCSCRQGNVAVTATPRRAGAGTVVNLAPQVDDFHQSRANRVITGARVLEFVSERAPEEPGSGSAEPFAFPSRGRPNRDRSG